eukprot:Gregarina_sp_Poly_1__5102@NODE_26_length_19795_cov_50_913828_g24_i0_p16_GENE_NODE_26_length_19795_cov_50_913828_g24_i0NODE_26_length_19795_cov_50_913828_g24_i0_p16_ORF_typecomplete_len103_score11_34_NODE_26_length_19795_cov_50_913828_g24_i01935019658
MASFFRAELTTHTMKSITIEQKGRVVDELLWKCLVGCGHALLIDSENLLICENSDSEESSSVFCGKLKLFLSKNKSQDESLEISVNGSFKTIPFSEADTFPC